MGRTNTKVSGKSRVTTKPKAAHLKLIAYEGERVKDATNHSDVLIDSKAIRETVSDVAREVLAQARQTAGTIKTLMQGRSDVFRMNPFDLYEKDGWNIREYDREEVLAHIDGLARDIARVGVTEPYTVYQDNQDKGRFYISNGHLRQRAVFRAMNVYNAKILTVPVRLAPPGQTEVERLLTQKRSNSGLAISPWEQGTLMKRLLGWGWSKAQIAEEFACSENHVQQMFDLQEYPEALAKHVRKGTIAASFATASLKQSQGNATAAVRIVETAIRNARAKAALTGVPEANVRVMPKHADPEKPRSKPGVRSAKTPVQKRLDDILLIIRNFSVTADGEGRWVASMPIEAGEKLAKLTGMETPGALPI